MLAINGEQLNIEKGKSALEVKLKNAWKHLNEKFELSEGKYINLKLKDEFKRNSVRVTPSYDVDTTVRVYPNSIGLGYSEKVYIDGDVKNVVCYDTRKKDKDGNYEYAPDSRRITKDTPLTINDKDLIIFLYAFSSQVEDAPEAKDIKIGRSKDTAPRFYFEDIKSEVKKRMGKLQRANKVFNLIEKINEQDLRRLSATLNIDSYDTLFVESLQEQLMDLAKEDKKWYDMIVDFTQSHDRIIYDVEEKVASAIAAKIFGFTKKQSVDKKDYVEWVHKKNGIPLPDVDPVLRTPGNKAEKETIITYFVQNPDAYNAFLIRIGKD